MEARRTGSTTKAVTANNNNLYENKYILPSSLRGPSHSKNILKWGFYHGLEGNCSISLKGQGVSMNGDTSHHADSWGNRKSLGGLVSRKSRRNGSSERD